MSKRFFPYAESLLSREEFLTHLRYRPQDGKVLHLDEDEIVRIRSKDQWVLIDRKRYPLRRVIWVIMTGEEPKGSVYHKNGDWRDYSWNNLTVSRPVTEKRRRSRNKKRTKLDPRTGKPLPVGVNEKRSKYYSIFTHEGQRYYSGICYTPEEAAEFYNTAVDIFLGTESRT